VVLKALAVAGFDRSVDETFVRQAMARFAAEL
jgi:hypothetical protein